MPVNRGRFSLLPHKTFPHPGSRCLRRPLQRCSADGQARSGLPVVLQKTFINPQQLCGTVFTTQGWQELDPPAGFGRVRCHLQVQHHRLKRLFARELDRHARRSLAAERLQPAPAVVEAQTRPQSTQSPAQIRLLLEHLQTMPDHLQAPRPEE